MKYAAISGRRVRRSTEEIAALVEEYRSSGLTQRAYARRKGLGLSTLTIWLRRARAGRVEGDSGRPRIVAVRLTEGNGLVDPDAPSGFELRLAGGINLSIPVNFDERALRRLLPLLAETC